MAAVVCRRRKSATPSLTPEASTGRCTASVIATNCGACDVGTLISMMRGVLDETG